MSWTDPNFNPDYVVPHFSRVAGTRAATEFSEVQALRAIEDYHGEFSQENFDRYRASCGLTTPRKIAAKRKDAVLRAGGALGLVSVQTTQTRSSASFSPDFVEPLEVGPHRSFVPVESFSPLERVSGLFKLDPAARRFASLRLAVGFAARAHAVSEKGFRSDVAFMVTMTYSGTNADWSSTDLSTAISAYRMWCARAGYPCRYVWVAELQKRGVIHYHFVAWLPVGAWMPCWDLMGWWRHGATNVKRAKHATAYLMHYLKKGDLKNRGKLPKGARNYGVGGLDSSLRRSRRWLRLPSFVQGNSSIHDDWKRRVGGGWISPTGEIFCSEFRVLFVGGNIYLENIYNHPRIISPSGPFSWLSDKEKVLH